jgi:glyoxylase-like metal-dependent hydrolase (beta-lactamase superfamily II)
MEIVQALGDTWYIPGPTNLGVYAREDRAVLVDSGNDESAGRNILKVLGEMGWEPDLIVNTHSNADHVGGNAFIQKRTGCRIASTRTESVFIEEPRFEPALLWGSAPFRAISGKFLQAQPSRVTDIIPSSGSVLETGLEAIPLPGHFLDMIGLRTPDGVFFIADSIFSSSILDKYGMVVCFDVAAQYRTLEYLESAEAELFIPCHAEVTGDLAPLVQRNRKALDEARERVIKACSSPASREDVLADLSGHFGIDLNPAQFVLTHITVSAHISHLADEGILNPVFEKGRMLWLSS